MSELFESVIQSRNPSQKSSRISLKGLKKPTAQPKILKQQTTENAYKSFILPQYQNLCEYSFLNNNLQLSTTASQTKDKLNEINQMIRNSQIQSKQQVNYQKESKQLKNENTINWLKKRYIDSGNKKYFGDQEDVQQSKFIKSIFENITRHLKTPEGVQINDLNRLIQQYELPLSFQVLSKIYQIVDHDRDSILNLQEFQDLILNDNANKIFLDQFKHRYKQYQNIIYKPTSLSALCIFISFRINHDFLTEFLYDSNFQVKDKSLGLIKMLDLIKVQGQTRIKSDFDKRMIRKLNVEQTAQLGFVSPQQKQNQQESSLQNEKSSLKQNDEIIYKNNNTSSDSNNDSDSFYSELDNMQKSSTTQRKSEKIIINTSDSKKNLNVKKTEFQKQMDQIIQKANSQGEKSAKNSYKAKRSLLQEIQVENQKVILSSIDSTKQLSTQKKAPFLPGLNLNTTNQTLQNYQSTKKFHSILDDKQQNENQMDEIKETTILNNSQLVPSYLKKNSSQGDITQKANKQGYSKHMTYLMDLTLQEAVNSKQSQIARKLMNIEDSAIIQQYRKKMDQIKTYQEQKKQLISPTPSPNKHFFTQEILQQLEGTSFAPKNKGFFQNQLSIAQQQ
ncbi:hypothetical protein TTHERM_00389970 (macronuclear) [Tetrahymena thermophila SB210]|uniref:EF-hand domain-containing protein n=1 Tax=Tetrahymena thermophila (strain SB210) TaxID=312017 RepID=Q23R91_TETTS|nr:hypothetical protein TTHERM_00389970 [Tetrahymena thermophila SB210]EAR99157.2 hypothetical protein TTHERM_00389970 [Tetrahymena thermophila SB210]|eukprot:XP_001019402.2 hypothetical protein TTHERM_00389970 [Tetrahymena thermophila SB210]